MKPNPRQLSLLEPNQADLFSWDETHKTKRTTSEEYVNQWREYAAFMDQIKKEGRRLP